MTDRKKPGVAFWATVALVVVLAYPLSFGPCAWIVDAAHMSPAIKISMGHFFAPCRWFYRAGPEPVRGWYQKYVWTWAGHHHAFETHSAQP